MRWRRLLARRTIAMMIAAAVAATVGVATYAAGAWTRVENDTLDMRFGLRGTEPPPSDVAVVAIDESRAEALQQEPGDRHSAHLELDEICKAGGQRSRQDDAVEVARVIRHDDARVVRLDVAAFDANGTAYHEQEELRGASR